jgi:hypothetical protein
MLIDILQWAYFLIAILGIVVFRKLSFQFRFVLAIQVYIALHEYFLSGFATTPYGMQFFVHLYCFVLSLLFYKVYSTLIVSEFLLRIVRIVSGLSVALIILNSIFLQGMDTMPTISINILQLMVITNACLLFLHLLDKPNSIPLNRDAVFWFNTSTFVYYCASYFIFTIPYYLIINQVNVDVPSFINLNLCLIYYPIIGYSLYLNANRAKYETSN